MSEMDAEDLLLALLAALFGTPDLSTAYHMFGALNVAKAVAILQRPRAPEAAAFTLLENKTIVPLELYSETGQKAELIEQGRRLGEMAAQFGFVRRITVDGVNHYTLRVQHQAP